MDIQNEKWFKEAIRTGVADKDPDTLCLALPAPVNSFGVWEQLEDKGNTATNYWQYSLPLLEAYIVVIFVLWQSIHVVFKRLGFPGRRLASQLLAGVVFSFLTHMKGNSAVRDILVPDPYRRTVIKTFSDFGLTLWWFLFGVQMDVRLAAGTERKVVATGIASMLVPFIVGSAVFRKKLLNSYPRREEVGHLIFLQSLTAFSSISQFLQDINMQNSELGRLALSASMVGDLLSISLGITLLFVRPINASKSLAMTDLLITVAIVLVSFFILRPAMLRVVRHTPEGQRVKEVYVFSVLLFGLACYIFWYALRQFPPFGSFVFAMMIPPGPPLGSALINMFETLNSALIVPVFVVTGISHLNLPQLIAAFREGDYNGSAYDALNVVILLSVVKFVASALPPFLFRMPLKDSVALGLILSTKGSIELLSYVFYVEKGLSDINSFSVMAMYMVINSVLTPIAVRYLYDPSKKLASYQRRNLMHLKPGSELRILACIHKPDHITSVIKLLEASDSSSVDYPIACDVVHLVELTGQAHPTFVSHQIRKPKVGISSYSDNVITSFDQFRKNTGGSIPVDMHTSVSAPKQMPEDVCLLAHYKAASLILLPFHRTWSADRSIVISSHEMLRNLNCEMLRQAPCSVGILVDRRCLTSRSIHERQPRGIEYRVCSVFAGGKDDREALALAKRMAQNPNVRLLVLRLLTAEESSRCLSEMTLDMKVLKDVKQGNNGGGARIAYVEETVTDGTHTASVLRNLALETDLFVVGQSSGGNNLVSKGLEEWTEFEELGVIGDLLASPDFISKASVLVVQQQMIAQD